MGAVLVAAGLLAGPAPASAVPAPPRAAAPVPAPVTRCAFDDPQLSEVSGLVWSPEGLWVVNDSGDAPTAYRLAPDCSVAGDREAGVDARDVEDLARDPDDTLWLADTGDNPRTRSSVAVLRLPAAGGAVRTRLVYPDGPHDVEAMLLGADGRPVLVTKDLGGRSALYAPDAPLPPTTAAPAASPVALRRVGELTLPASTTPTTGRGALALLGGGLVTGGAVSPDGRAAVLRTYTDAWVYPLTPGGRADADAVLAALTGTPFGVPLPGEPQGEAVALTPDGTLLSAGESPPGEDTGTLREVPRVVAAALEGGTPGSATGADPAGERSVGDGDGGGAGGDAGPVALPTGDAPWGPDTTVAVAAAAFVALAAGSAAVWWRRSRRGRGRSRGR